VKNIFKTVLITLLFLILSIRTGNAAVLNSQFISEKIQKDVAKQINSFVSGKIEVEVKNIPYSTISVPKGDLQVLTRTNFNYFSPLTVIKVDVVVNGQEIITFGVPVKITVWDNVWVAKDVINRGESLNSSNLSLEMKDVTFIAENAVRQNVSFNNNLVKKRFVPGEIIDKRFVEVAPLVTKNSFVSIIFKMDDITVTADGQALDNGKIGDYIKVSNKKYRKEYTGKVIGANTIQVNL
jgi:flagella basal body P-ring formation protein FlgA